MTVNHSDSLMKVHRMLCTMVSITSLPEVQLVKEALSVLAIRSLSFMKSNL